jgi:hypothetical protein
MEQILELHAHEDVHSVRDRLEFAQSDRVLLVIPPFSDVLRRRVDLQRIQRLAHTKRLEIALVTSDLNQRAMAAELGIPTFFTVEAGQRRRRWRAADDDGFGPYRPPDRSEAHRAAQERDARSVVDPLRRRIWTWVKGAILAMVGASLIFGVVAVVPSAEVYLVPQSQRVVANALVVVDSELAAVDVAAGRVPARTVITEVRGEITVPTTGRRFLPASRAAGVVFFVNQLNIPFKVQQGTVVRTSAGAQATRFVVTSEVDVPGGIGAQAQAPIEAVEPGAQGNVPPNFINEIEGVAALSLRVSNPDSTRGGADREVTAVAPEDLLTARELLLEQLESQALAQMAADELSETEFLLTGSLAVDFIFDATYDHEVTEQTTELTLQMRAQFSTLAVDSADANAIVFEAMQRQAPAGYGLLPEGLLFQRGGEQLVGESGSYQFEMQGIGYAAADIDVGRALEAIAGKPLDAATAILQEELPLRQAPRISVSPRWFPIAPLLPVRMHAVVDASG